MTAHKEHEQNVTPQASHPMCAWCESTVSAGTLVARALDDDPVPTQGMSTATKVLGRMCLKCGMHWHGGKGESGEYHFLTDKARRRRKRKGKGT